LEGAERVGEVGLAKDVRRRQSSHGCAHTPYAGITRTGSCGRRIALSARIFPELPRLFGCLRQRSARGARCGHHAPRRRPAHAACPADSAAPVLVSALAPSVSVVALLLQLPT